MRTERISFMLLLLVCHIMHNTQYIFPLILCLGFNCIYKIADVEINRDIENECKEVIRERPYKKGLFKKVLYKVKKECRKKKKDR